MKRVEAMRIVVSLFFICAISLNVNGKPAGNYREISANDYTIMVRNKRDDDSSNVYLEQCGVVKFQHAKRGFVNVLAFLDSSWPYSHRQAIMLKMLSDRLRKSGLIETLFFAVNVEPYSTGELDSADDDIEREAWLGVSPEEIEGFTEIDKNFDSLAKQMDPGIRIIQDNEELGIWKSLGGSRDQVLVIDRCGKLTYQVIVPWSILHFPYVKAAILSTYKDEPCGPCDVSSNDNTDWTGYNDLERLLGAISPDVSVKDAVTLGDPGTMIEPRIEDNAGPGLDAPKEETTGESISSHRPITLDRIGANDQATIVNDFDSPTTQVSGTEDATNDSTSKDYLPDREAEKEDEEIIFNLSDTLSSTSEEENTDFRTESLLHREETTASGFFDSPDTQQDFRFAGILMNFRQRAKAEGHENDTEDTISNLETSPDAEDSTTKDDATSSTVTTLPENPSIVPNLKLINDDPNDANYVTTNFYETTTDNYVDDIDERTPEVTAGIVTKPSHDYEDDVATPKMADTLHYTTTELITFDARDVNCTTTNIDEATTEMDDIYDKTPEVVATTDARHFVNENMYNVDVHPKVNYDTTSTYQATSGFKVEEIDDKTPEAITGTVVNHSRHFEDDAINDHEAADKIVNGVDTTTEYILTSKTHDIIGTTEEETSKPQESEDNEDYEKVTNLPIRIIMHAPHFHIDRDSTRMHEYIVLRTGSSNVHGHLASNDATRLYSGPQDYYEEMGNLTAEEIEKKKWPMKNLIFLNDESTGLFGEVADYWRDNESQDNYEDADDTERPEDGRFYEEESVNEKSWTQSPNGKDEKIQNGVDVIEDKTNKSTENSNGPITSIESHTTEVQRITQSEETNYREEEETRNKLIAHYSKLLPWIYYVLDK